MDRGGDQLLAGSALALDQHGRVGGRHRRDRLLHLTDRGRRPHELPLGERPSELGAERPHLALEPASLHELAHQMAQLVQLRGLGQIVIRARLQRPDRGRDHRITGDHDDVDRGVVVLDRLEQRETVHVGHADVEDRRLEDLALEEPERLTSTRGEGGLVSPPGQSFGEEVSHFSIVVDDEET